MTKPNVFTINDTNFFKGIGILLIIIHNYCHWQNGFRLENEASFDVNNAKSFLTYLCSFNFTNIFNALFSFLGHYGVQIFIVLSSYGLGLQYENKTISTKQFVLKKLQKIYFLLGFTILFWIVFNLVIGNKVYPKSVLWESFLIGTTLSNFFWLYKIFSGPYWFFALTIQLYILYPLLYKFVTLFTLKNIWIPFLIAYFLIYVLYYITLGTSFKVFGIIIGHIPEVFLGILMAQYKFTKFGKIIIATSLLLFILSQFYEFLFPLSFLAVSIIIITGISFIKKYSNKYITKFILYVGGISMMLFIVNGPLRAVSWFALENQEIRFWRILIFIPLLFIISQLLFLLYNKIYQLLKI